MSREHRVPRKDLPGTNISVRQTVQTQEIHCIGCGRFIGFQAIVWGAVKLKCPRCKEWTTIDIQTDK